MRGNRRDITMKFMTPEGHFISFSPGDRRSVREDGRVEQLCDHGVGHPVGHLEKWEDWMYCHGCDGCCEEVAE